MKEGKNSIFNILYLYKINEPFSNSYNNYIIIIMNLNKKKTNKLK
jgi:hypothetical protein